MESNKVDIYIASLWRGGHVIKTINSLLTCSELNTITVVCNNYTPAQIEQVRSEVNNVRLILIKGDNAKGCSEKLRYIHTGSSQYIALCDDDLIYPANYLTKLIDAAEKHKCLVSMHGRILKKEKATNYYRHRSILYHCLYEVKEDVEVNIVGSGVCLFERNLIPKINSIYGSIAYPNMTDIYLSFFFLMNNIKRMVVAHPSNWITSKTPELNDNNIFDAQKNDCKIQTEFINKLFLGYE